MTKNLKPSEIKIGKFTISQNPLWITINDLDPDRQGEGGEFHEEEFEKVIGKFYEQFF